jgi:Fanconi anemia group M protein
MIYDIFKFKRKKEKAKSKIIVDVHEKNSLVFANLIELGKGDVEIEVKKIAIGDYIAKDVVIERKTLSDFISSMISKRLIQQLDNLKRYKRKMLIVEGYIEKKIEFNKNALRGMILSIALEHNIPVIFTRDSEETAEYLLVLARKPEKYSEVSLHSRKGMSEEKRKQYIIESFPGIGPKTAHKLIKEFKTIRNIINASQDELKKVIGKKAEIFKICRD